MHTSKSIAGFRISDVSSWLLLLVLLTIILKTLGFLFIPLCFAILACYAMGIPLDYLKRLKVPSFLRILIVIVIVSSSYHRLMALA